MKDIERGKALMSLQSCSDLARFFQELYILTTKASQGRSVTQENFCHSLELVGDERVNGKLRSRGGGGVTVDLHRRSPATVLPCSGLAGFLGA